MAQRPPTYRRLPGRGAMLTSYVRLYQGPDHLLQVLSTGFTETYKRFFFRDVQALLVVRTGYWTALSIVLGVLTLGTLFISLFFFAAGTPDLRVAGIVMGSLGLVLALAVVLNFVWGPSCRCLIRTAVQVEQLPSLSRLRTAQRVIAQLRPLMESAQATLVPEGARSTGSPAASESPGAPPVIQRPPATAAPETSLSQSPPPPA